MKDKDYLEEGGFDELYQLIKAWGDSCGKNKE